MFARIRSLLFENRGTKQTVVKNVFWIGLSQMAGRFIRAFFVVYAARLLGASEYGVFSYALGLAAFFTVFGDLGIGPVLTREISKNIKNENSYFGTAFIIKITISFFAAALLMLVTPFFSNVAEANVLLPLAALLIIADNLREFGSAFFRAKERMELEAISVLTTNILITGGGLAVLFFFPSLTWLMGVYTAGSAIGMIVSLFFVRKPLLDGIKKFDLKLLRPILFAAIPFSLTGILGGLLLNTDMMILGWMQTATDIGLYSASQKIVYILYILPAILVGGLFPPLSRYISQNNRDGARAILKKGTVLLSGIAFPIVAGGLILARPIMNFLFGSEYLVGTLSFQVLILTILSVFPTALYASFLFASNKQATMAVLSVIMVIGNLILDIIFIRLWGFVGCSVATLFMQIIYWILIVRLVKKHTPFSAFAGLKNIFVATVIMSASVFLFSLLNFPLFIIIVIGFLVYFGSLFKLKEPALDEIFSIIKKHTANIGTEKIH